LWWELLCPHLTMLKCASTGAAVTQLWEGKHLHNSKWGHGDLSLSTQNFSKSIFSMSAKLAKLFIFLWICSLDSPL
jgi:hypothetical protein